MENLEQVKELVKAGKKVFWKNGAYLVIFNPANDEFLVQGHGHAISLFWVDNVTSDFNAEDFFAPELKSFKVIFMYEGETKTEIVRAENETKAMFQVMDSYGFGASSILEILENEDGEVIDIEVRERQFIVEDSEPMTIGQHLCDSHGWTKFAIEVMLDMKLGDEGQLHGDFAVNIKRVK